MIAGRARFRFQRQIGRLAGYHLPEGAFQGAVMEALLSIPYDSFDRSTRDQIISFIKTFMSCRCPNSPLCGCPERNFTREIIELRESGLDHRHISQYLLEEFGIEIYAADLLSFLEETVHLLEAVRDVAAHSQVQRIEELAEEHILAIESGKPVS